MSQHKFKVGDRVAGLIETDWYGTITEIYNISAEVQWDWAVEDESATEDLENLRKLTKLELALK